MLNSLGDGLQRIKDRGQFVLFYADPQTKVKYGVLEWVTELKIRYGIQDPSEKMFQARPPTTGEGS